MPWESRRIQFAKLCCRCAQVAPPECSDATLAVYVIRPSEGTNVPSPAMQNANRDAIQALEPGRPSKRPGPLWGMMGQGAATIHRLHSGGDDRT